MEYKINSIEDTVQEIEFIIFNDELTPAYNKALLKLQPKVALQGFRKGKVPLGMVKNMYGESVKYDAQQDLVNDKFREVIKEKKIGVIGTPSLIDISEVDGGIKATVRYEVIPEFELTDYKSLTIDEPVHIVTDEEVNLEIDNIKQEHSSFEDADEVLNSLYVVGVTMDALDKETYEPIEGVKPEELNLFLDDPKLLPELKEILLNAKLGDKFNFKAPDSISADKNTFLITVNTVQKLIPAILDEEFISNFTQNRITSLEDLREEISFQMQNEWDKRTRDILESQIIQQIVEANQISMPDELVDNVTDALFDDYKKDMESQQKGSSKALAGMKREQYAPVFLQRAEQTVRWELIRNKIIEKEKIEIEDFDYENFAEEQSKLMNSEKGKILEIIKKNDNVKHNLLSKKVMDLLLDFATTNEVTFEEYEEKYKHVHSQDHDEHDHNHDEHDHDNDEHNHNHDEHDHDHDELDHNHDEHDHKH